MKKNVQAVMSQILRSYLKFARGERAFPLWSLLYPFQFVTRAWMKFRVCMYDRGIFEVEDLALPVISVGNNSLGGTNKTPMVEHIVRLLQEAGIEAGMVSRGYRAKDHAPIWIGQDEESLHRETAGDEPLMLAGRLPGAKIVVSKDRVKGVELLKSLGAQIAVTDDTFQHRRMARDVDIVLVDAMSPFGNGSVIPAGSMREPMSAYKRADILVITRANQVTAEKIFEIKRKLEAWVSSDKIFTAEIALESWLEISEGQQTVYTERQHPKGKYIAFSAIGNPPAFYKYLGAKGVEIVQVSSYRDHHIFTKEDFTDLRELALENGANGFICTEKDLFNIPKNLDLGLPLYVPRIAITLDDELAFRKRILEKLKPRLMVASNGYGEDAMGVVLARKLRERFPLAEVSAFVLVGSGRHYQREGFEVLSPASEMPSGGVIKYSLVDLFKDIRHGLGRSIRRQIDTMQKLRGKYRTPVCVGDVYLLVNVLWGQGLKPLLVATAKSVHLTGHFRIERWLLKKRSRFVWTRDAETAQELKSSGVNAAFAGNPIMDLIDEAIRETPWAGSRGRRVMLLAGSRPRAYDDMKLVLDAAELLSSRVECSFVSVMAPTIDIRKMSESLAGWELSEDETVIRRGTVTVRFYLGQVADAARDAELLIGLGGTANQVCAGLGVPVVSILEKGKLRQKKLLEDAEILVKAAPEELADAAEKILANETLHRKMSETGIRRLGGTGALDTVVEYCADVLGWENRCSVYEKYGKYLDKLEQEMLECFKEL